MTRQQLGSQRFASLPTAQEGATSWPHNCSISAQETAVKQERGWALLRTTQTIGKQHYYFLHPTSPVPKPQVKPFRITELASVILCDIIDLFAAQCLTREVNIITSQEVSNLRNGDITGCGQSECSRIMQLGVSVIHHPQPGILGHATTTGH